MTTYQHIQLPEIASGYQLDSQIKSFWMAAIPEATTNLITNPSFETATTGYTNSSFTAMARSTDKATGGVYALKLTPNGSTANNAYYALSGLTQDAVYTWALDVWGYTGQTITLSARDNTSPSTILGTKNHRFEQQGWERVYITWKHATANAARLQLTVSADTPASQFCYTDRWQVEAKAYMTTYVDGDELPYRGDTNPYAFLWTGSAHESQSKRSSNAIGGKFVAFETFGFRTSGVQGLGMGSYEATYSTENLGGYLKGLFRKRRQFTITGRIYGESIKDLMRKKQDLIDALRPRWNGVIQPIRLFYQPVTQYGKPFGKLVYIDAVCIEGLSGNFTSFSGEEFALVFQADDPNLKEYYGQGYDTLTPQVTTASTGVVEKDENGDFTRLTGATASNGTVDAVAYRNDGQLLAGGSFTSFSGASYNRIAIYDPATATWAEPTGGGLNGAVKGIAAGNGLEVGVVGAFTQDDATNTLRRAAIHDGSAWSEMANGLNGQANAIVAYPNGDYYVGGAFTQTGAGGTLRRFARYNAATGAWVEPGTGFDNTVNTLMLGIDGKIYIGGDFLNSGDTNTGFAYIAAYDPLTDTFDDLGGGFANGVFGLAFGPGNFLYAVGSFQTEWLGVREVKRIGRWNGGHWEEVGGGLDNYPSALGWDGKLLYVSGAFTDPITGILITKAESVACWDGNNWVPGPYETEDMATGFTLSRSGRFAIAQGAMTGSPFFTAMQTKTVTNTGTAETRPVFVVSNGDTSTHYVTRLSNITTGQDIYFDMLPVQAGNTTIIDFRQIDPIITNETGADLTRFILHGASSSEDFRLVVGENVVGFMADTSDITMSIHWPIMHWSIDGVV